MPYQITFTNNKTGKVMTRTADQYMAAYRILSDWAYQVGYEVHSLHAEKMVVAGTLNSDYFIFLTQTNPSNS